MGWAIVRLVLTLQAIQRGAIAKPAASAKKIDRLFQRILADRVLDSTTFANQKPISIGVGQKVVSPVRASHSRTVHQ